MNSQLDDEQKSIISDGETANSMNPERDLFREENILLLDEDHFSVNSELELFDELEINPNLNREEQIEIAISRLTKQLALTTTTPTATSSSTTTESQASTDYSIEKLSMKECQDKKKRIVKQICDLKVKLVQLKEEDYRSEFEDGNSISLSSTSDFPDALMARRQYSFRKNVAGHKLVLTADIFENENRFRSVWKKASQSKPTPTSSPSSTVSSTKTSSPPANSLVSSTLSQTTKILQLINNTSNQLYILANNLSGTQSQATNPFSPLVCDHCCKKSTKSINEIVLETFKFIKPTGSKLSSQQVKENVFRNNPYLACIYCFYTVHVNCLNSRPVRRCPKLYFDENDSESLVDEQSLQFYGKPARDLDNVSIPSDLSRLMNRSKRVILDLKPEIGLTSQEFRCAECRILIHPPDYKPPPNSKQSVSRSLFCDFTGLYFCEYCHFSDTAIIPGRVIHNWDFNPYPVSRIALQIISYIRNTSFHYDRPVLFNLVDLNSMLYGLIEDLVLVKRIRTELCQIYKYISICKQPTRPKNWILTQLGEHLLDERLIAFHSFIDLCELKNLIINLSEVEQLFINHINSCPGCQGKGFFCELCSNREDVLFPFSPNTTICIKCSAIYHKNCFYRRNRICVRCARIKDKQIKEEAVLDILPSKNDIASD